MGWLPADYTVRVAANERFSYLRRLGWWLGAPVVFLLELGAWHATRLMVFPSVGFLLGWFVVVYVGVRLVVWSVQEWEFFS